MVWGTIYRLIKYELREETMNIIDKIKAYWKVKGMVEEIQKDIKEAQMNTVKPGWKSSEFWSKVIIQILAIISALNGIIDPKMALIATTILEAVYSIMRALVKQPNITTVVDNSTK